MPATETVFTAIRIEGGLLPPEFLQHVAALEAPAQSSADYGIPPGRTVRDEIGRYWTIAEALWKDYRQNRTRTDMLAQRTGVERWLVRLLRDVLGYADIAPAVASVAIGERRFPITHRAFAGAVPLLLTVADRDLDKSHANFGDEGRRRAPHAALQEFLNADAASLWGILANGPCLRLLRKNSKDAWIAVAMPSNNVDVGDRDLLDLGRDLVTMSCRRPTLKCAASILHSHFFCHDYSIQPGDGWSP